MVAETGFVERVRSASLPSQTELERPKSTLVANLAGVAKGNGVRQERSASVSAPAAAETESVPGVRSDLVSQFKGLRGGDAVPAAFESDFGKLSVEEAMQAYALNRGEPALPEATEPKQRVSDEDAAAVEEFLDDVSLDGLDEEPDPLPAPGAPGGEAGNAAPAPAANAAGGPAATAPASVLVGGPSCADLFREEALTHFFALGTPDQAVALRSMYDASTESHAQQKIDAFAKGLMAHSIMIDADPALSDTEKAQKLALVKEGAAPVIALILKAGLGKKTPIGAYYAGSIFSNNMKRHDAFIKLTGQVFDLIGANTSKGRQLLSDAVVEHRVGPYVKALFEDALSGTIATDSRQFLQHVLDTSANAAVRDVFAGLEKDFSKKGLTLGDMDAMLELVLSLAKLVRKPASKLPEAAPAATRKPTPAPAPASPPTPTPTSVPTPAPTSPTVPPELGALEVDSGDLPSPPIAAVALPRPMPTPMPEADIDTDSDIDTDIDMDTDTDTDTDSEAEAPIAERTADGDSRSNFLKIRQFWENREGGGEGDASSLRPLSRGMDQSVAYSAFKSDPVELTWNRNLERRKTGKPQPRNAEFFRPPAAVEETVQ